MTDGVFPDRLTQLRARWEADPSSRIFLQLAEEYRHLGRMQEALVVLDRGLKEHPGYLSALVAKGRCHIELGEGEAARTVLERVVKQDATQMVANKLLVRAYLETGDPVKARERLDLYSLLNDSDPEIEELRRRIRQLERPVQAAPADVFDLDAPAPPARGGDDIFELSPAPPPVPRPAAPAPAAPDLFELEPLAARGPAPAPILAAPFALETPPPPIPAAVAAPEEDETVVDENLLFPELSSQDRRRRYLDALGAEGLFAFEPPPAPPAPAPPDEASWLDEAPAAPPAPAPESLMPAIFAEPPATGPEPETTTAEDLWSEEPAPEPAAPGDDLLPAIDIEAAAEPEPFDFAPPPMPVFEPEPAVEAFPEPEPEEPAGEPVPASAVATATLGELYFRQGHYGEAERIFREVLEREPGNAAAVAALERIAALGPQPETPRLDARRLLTGYRRDPSQLADAEARSRKIFLLNRYLDRLRQGSSPDVP